MRWGENGEASQTLLLCGWMGGWHLADTCSAISDPPVDSGPFENGAVEDFPDPLSVALIFCMGKKSEIFCRHTGNSAVGNFCEYFIKRLFLARKIWLD